MEMRIGRFDFGIRKYGREFKWFYHPLLKSNEERSFVFFVWIGWHFYACLRKKRCLNKGRSVERDD